MYKKVPAMTPRERAERLMLQIRELDKNSADGGLAFVTEYLELVEEFEADARAAALEEAAKIADGVGESCIKNGWNVTKGKGSFVCRAERIADDIAKAIREQKQS